MEFRLPSPGENITAADVTKVLVEVGAVVAKGAPLLEIETEKASAPVESPVAGRIEKVLVKAGEKIKVGQLLFEIAQAGAPAALAGKPPVAPSASAAVAAKAANAPTASANPASATAVADKPPANSALVDKPPVAQPSRFEFHLPNLGDNVAAADVVKVMVKAGDVVAVGAPLFEIETEKASAPVESPVAGRVEEVRVKAGAKIKPGDLAVVFTATALPAKSNGGGAPARRPAASPPTVSRPAAPAARFTPPTAATIPVLVERNGGVVPAGPATRRLARELGVDLRLVPGSGRGGRVTLDDVKAFVRSNGGRPFPAAAVSAEPAAPPLPDFSKWGEIERKPVNAVRRKTAEHMSLAWRTCPQVTQYDLADVTELEAARKKAGAAAGPGAPKITMTVLMIKAVAAVIKEMPKFAASYDPASGELIYKKYVHIGIAVDTEHGLFVPVVRDAGTKNLTDLAKEITELAEKARNRKLTIDEMRGGVFTITNLGGIGGTAFSPIVNLPEVAILGLSRSSQQYVLHNGQPAFRLMLPLCLSYDHRVIDGADAARFTTRLSALLSEPGKSIG